MALSLNQAQNKKKKTKTKAKARDKKTSKKKTKKIQPWQNKNLEAAEKIHLTNYDIDSSIIDESLYEGMEVYPEEYTTQLLNDLKTVSWQSIRHPKKTAKRYGAIVGANALSKIKKILPKIV